MAILDELEAELADQIDLISKEFLLRYLPAKPEEGPDVYHQHVKAFCILAHAAFEEFVEHVSLALMANAIDGWYKNRSISSPLMSLLLFYKAAIECNEIEDEDQHRNFEQIRQSIEAVKRSHSKAVFDNHGFSLKYLRSILTPVAIDISNDPSLSNSLRTLADARGSYAHTTAELGMFVDRNRAKHPMTPEKARDVVNDCLALCKKISEDAKRFFIS
jgi:hypothetical protein